MGRKRSPDSRRARAERKRAQKVAEAAARLAEHGSPNVKIMARREAFAFVTAERGGSIDQDIHDGIGRLHALGFLEGFRHDPKDLRDIGREYAELYWERYSNLAPKTGQYDRRSPATGEPPPRTARYDRFDRLNSAVPRNTVERTALHMLLTDHYHSDDLAGWVKRLVHGLGCGHDRHMLEAAVYGLGMMLEIGLRRVA